MDFAIRDARRFATAAKHRGGGVDVDSGQALGDGERLEDAAKLGAKLCAAEIPFFPIGTALSARSRWFVSNDTLGPGRNTSSPARHSRA